MEYITKGELAILSDLLSKLDKERHANWEIGMKAYDLRVIVDKMRGEKPVVSKVASDWEPCNCPPGQMCFKCRV